MIMGLRAPFPWPGGKSRAAHLIWSAFGDVANYVEPFAGSLAVLLARPTAPRIETVNDADCYLANFYRAVQHAPEDVARFVDWPVNEADLHARHLWLVSRTDFRERMKTDPEFFDAKIAGWWVWGLCAWIGTGWCDLTRAAPATQIPHLGTAGMGVHRKIPHLGDAGRGQFAGLSERLRRVRVACGDWSRVMGDSVTWCHGVTGVLLDPPYDDGEAMYSAGGQGIAADVRAWCAEHGNNPMLRIALCGYEGDPEPVGWTKVAWKAHGGYGSQRKDGTNDNARRERIWFSPHCLGAGEQLELFGGEST